jgi:methyl-accepting chemotaxis protein PixJ
MLKIFSNSSKEQPPLEKESQSNRNAMAQMLTHQTTSLTNEIYQNKLQAIATKIRQASSERDAIAIGVMEVREALEASRVLIYQFKSSTMGEIVAESVQSGFTPAIKQQLPADVFGPQQASDYQFQRFVTLGNSDRLTPYQQQLFAQFQIQASIAFPILLNATSDNASHKVWGLLIVQQCDPRSAPGGNRSRQWQDDEIYLLDRIALELTLSLQSTSSLLYLGQQSDLLTAINQQARQLMQSWSEEIRRSLQADRVIVYGFNPDWSGEVLAESVDSNWVKAGTLFDRDFFFKGGQYKEYYIANDLNTKGLAQAVLEVFEKMQVRAYIVVPIHANNQLLGLIGIYQNSGPRNWQESDVKFALNFAEKCSLPLQKTTYLRHTQYQAKQMEKALQREQTLGQMLERMRAAKDEQIVFQIATQEGRKLLNVDRLGIYRFDPDWGGRFIAEAATPGWKNLMETIPVVKDTYLQDTQGGRYKFGECLAIEDIYLSGHQACHIEILEQFEARAYIIAPIFLTDNILGEKKLWGLLGAYHNTGAYRWQTEEVEIMRQIGLQIGIAMQQIDYINKLQARAEQEKASNRIAEKIRQISDIKEIFAIATQEVRQALKGDRTLVYRFKPDWSGQVVAESVGSGWVSLLNQQANNDIFKSDRCILRKWSKGDAIETDTYFQQTQGGGFVRGQKYTAADNIYAKSFPSCYIESLEKYQAKAYVIVPIFQGDKLWGLLGVYQNSGARNWQESEIALMVQVASQLAVALQQTVYVKRLQQQAQQQTVAAERAKATATIISKIRQAQDVTTIFKATTQEVRQALKTDRTLVYQFNPDWSGQVLVESVGSGWVSLLIEQSNDEILKGDRTSSDRCIVRKWSTIDTTVNDTYMQQTRGDRYVQGQRATVVDNIYTKKFPSCYIESLEKYQAKAYIIVPVFQGDKLWGLLGTYQNSGTRNWQESEVELMVQVANQLAIALQQRQLLEQLQNRGEEMARRAEREAAIIQFSARLVSRLTELAQENADPSAIIDFATNELRRVLKASQVGVYRIETNQKGELVSKSAGSESYKQTGTGLVQVRDFYLQETQKGRNIPHESLRVDDIYTAQHDSDRIAMLEQQGIAAYMISPIFKGEQLWGLLGISQNDRPRQWENSEQAILEQVATQIGVALQLSEYLSQVRSQERQLSEVAERERAARENLQREALQILRAIEPSFRGDLTVRAPLSETEIGTIADGYNTTIQSLRELVRQVQVTASSVSQTSSGNTALVAELSEQAQQQVDRLERAFAQLQLMVASTQEVTSCAQKVEQAVQDANRTVNVGDSLMERTVNEILEIRQTASETGKKVKRLGEAFQKITKVVNLIENFATQTNLLALNAAIEATRAGEYGKGFAVVADEVRSLAYQSANATTEISRLVHEIQAGTNEVTEAMEIGVAQVVRGTELVNETRQSLNAIVTATSQISELVQAITQAASTQSQQSQNLTAAMSDVSAIALQTSESSSKISESFQQLLATSQELQTSVSQFKVD